VKATRVAGTNLIRRHTGTDALVCPHDVEQGKEKEWRPMDAKSILIEEKNRDSNMNENTRLITLYEKAITAALNKKIIIMDTPLIRIIALFALPLSPCLIIYFITNEPFAVIMFFYIIVAFLLILGVIGTLIRNIENRKAFRLVWQNILQEKDQPYLFNKYIYDNINFHKHTKIGHFKTICKIFSIFQVFPILKMHKDIAKIYSEPLLAIGLLSTGILIMLHCGDERLEALKIALQFSQENTSGNKGKDEPPQAS